MRLRTLLGGALSTCLLLSLTSCATDAPVRVQAITVHDPVIVAVPRELTQVVAEPRLSSGDITNADVAHYILILRQALASANAKLQAIAGLK